MLPVLMASFALVLSVVGLAALAWLTWQFVVLEHEWALRQSAMLTTLAALEKATPTQLRAEVDDLRGALDVMRTSNRKELGSLWGRLGGKPNGDSHVLQTHAANDGSFEALLDLQSRPPAGPSP